MHCGIEAKKVILKSYFLGLLRRDFEFRRLKASLAIFVVPKKILPLFYRTDPSNPILKALVLKH